MNLEKNNFKNSRNERPKVLDFSLQSNTTKPIDMERIMGKPSNEETVDTTKNDSSKQEGD